MLSNLNRVYTTCHSQQSDQGQRLHCHSQEQSDQGLYYLPFSAVWSWSTLFAILHSSLIRVYTVCHSQQSDQDLHYLPFSAVWSRSTSTLSFSGTFWSGSTQFPILSSLIKVYTVCNSQQSDQGLHYLPFSAVSSRSTLFAILSSLFRITLFPIISSLIRVYTVCHSQQSDQGLNYLPFSVWSGSTLFAILSSLIKVYTICHSQQSDQGLHYLPFSTAVWSGSTLFAILSSLVKVKVYTVILRNSLIRVYTVCHSRQSDQSLHCLPFSAVWSGSTLFAILSSQNRVYTVCHSKSDQGLHYLPFSAVWSRSMSTLSFSGTFWSGSTRFPILSSLIKVYTVCHSQQSDQGLYYLPFSAVSSRSTLFAILSSLFRVTLFPIISSLIRVYTVCHSQQSDQGLHYLPFSVWLAYTVCHSQQSDQSLHYLPFSAVWSGSTLFAILHSSLIRIYTTCHSQQSDQGQGLHCHS